LPVTINHIIQFGDASLSENLFVGYAHVFAVFFDTLAQEIFLVDEVT